MKRTNFFIGINDDREPHEVALEWLIAQNLKPGDEVLQTDITRALCMVDAENLTDVRSFDRWRLARVPQVAAMLDEFEKRTGLVLEATGRGSYRVLYPEEVADTIGEKARRGMVALAKGSASRIGRANKEGISAAELARRSAEAQYLNNVRTFMIRERRPSLSDEEDTPPDSAASGKGPAP